MKIMLTIVSMILITLLSCTTEPKEPIIEGPPELPNKPVDVKYIEVPSQSNVVTPKYWKEFKTDIKAIFFFSKIDSLEKHLVESKDVAKTFCSNNEIDYHEYYTDDDYGMVQLNDSLFFDMTEYLNDYQEGFVFLKQGYQLVMSRQDLTEGEFIEDELDFFEEEEEEEEGED